MPQSSLAPSDRWALSFGSAYLLYTLALRCLFINTSRSDNLKHDLTFANE
jgi:hypothetical protein